jgi:hypothetical protein
MSIFIVPATNISRANSIARGGRGPFEIAASQAHDPAAGRPAARPKGFRRLEKRPPHYAGAAKPVGSRSDSKAVRAAIDIGFRDLNLHRIEAGVEPGNIRSIRLARKMKMRREGLKKRAIYLRGRWVDLIVYTLTSEDLGYRFNLTELQKKRR